MDRRLWACLVFLAACAANQVPQPQAEGPDEIRSAQAALQLDPVKTMVVVAHQDDDVGLPQPDDTNTIRQPGAKFVSITMTTGDAGFVCGNGTTKPCNDAYIKGRETGQLAAYATMAQVPYSASNPEAVWTNTEVALANGKRVRKRVLSGGKVTMIYLGFSNHDQELTKLWLNSVASIKTLKCDTRVAAQQTYTRQELIETLRLLMAEYGPTQINTLDSTRMWPETFPFDHEDHVASALFALSASQKYSTAHGLRMYRTYNPNLVEPENVNPIDAKMKVDLIAIYGAWDDWFPNAHNGFCPTGTVTMCDNQVSVCQDPQLFWGGLEYRQYSMAPVHGKGVRGAIAAPNDACLKVSSATAGTAVTTGTCSFASAGQEWILGTDDTIRPAAATGLCVTALGASTVIKPGHIALTLRTCAAVGATTAFDQKFYVMTNGQMRGPDATCVAQNSGALSLYECEDVSNQEGYRVQFYPSTSTAATTGFTAAEIPNRFDIYHAISYGDLDGPAVTPIRADVCVRRSNGVWCSKSTGTGFAAPVKFTSQFADTAPFGTPAFAGDEYGSTVQLADVNGDKKADLCGRGDDGIYCAIGNGTSFAAMTKWSSGFDFSDLVGYDSGSFAYGTVHFPDVNKDGFADVCARNSAGIECAINKKTSAGFNGVKQWLTGEFSDALFWDNDSSGSTVQFPDVDGDGYPDVCGRATDGIRCAINYGGTAFKQPHLFGASDDFDDLTGWSLSRSNYGSIHFGDLNGDGKADVCGRSGDGLVCGISMGSSFGISARMIPIDGFEDTLWAPDQYGSTVALADIDGDGHADACGRGRYVEAGVTKVGLRCAFSP